MTCAAMGVFVMAAIASITNGFVTPTIPGILNRIRPQHQLHAWPWIQRQRKHDLPSKEDDYFKRIVDASHDPVAFEKFVMAKDGKIAEPSDTVKDPSDDSSTSSPKKGYQRIEEWDAKRNKDDMSWEERVQFDGQRFGNQFQQNEILRKNLKSF